MTVSESFKAVLVGVALIVVPSCTSTTPHPERWRFRITARDGTFVGGAVLELSRERTNASCLGGSELILARIVEKHGFTRDQIGDSAGVSLKDGRIYADLSLGVCDNTLTVSGPLRGDRAAGEARRSTLMGAFLVGQFVAEREP